MREEESGLRMLLVDDATFARDFVTLVLAEVDSDINIEWRGDYVSGLEALTYGGFDVCLLDYQLGDRSGLDLLREAKAHGVRTPIVMLTSDTRRELDEEAMRAGAADYLVKGDFTGLSLDRIVRYLVARTRAEEAMRDSQERYALAMAGSNDGLWDWRVDAKSIHLSPRWKQILGFEPDELPDLIDAWWSRVHEDDRGRLMRDFEAHVRVGSSPHFENEHRLLHKDGTWRHVLVRGKAVRDLAGHATRIAGSLTDVTLAKSRDPLTGLPNRVLYLDRLEHAFNRAQRDPDYRYALLFVDLDRFKNINDSLGHDVGDELLVGFARRIERCVRLVDTVARLGGDEFVILLDDTREPDGATRVAKRIMEELTRPFVIGAHSLFSTVSIGIALSQNSYRTPGEMLRDADTAMYRAKAEGRARYVVFDSAMHARAMHVLSVEQELRRALEHNELEVFYQPVVMLDSEKPYGFEALVRWRHPQQGLLSPGNFIVVAEESDLIVQLDLYVLGFAAAQVRAWRDELQQDFVVSVNASRRHFSHGGYVADVQQVLAVTGLPARALRLEVTESITMDFAETARAQLQQLHGLGIQLYVDDFGVGYSSLSMLHTYPFSGLKLDRSFIAQLDGPSPSTEVVRAIMAIAQTLGLDVVAEGVETLGQHQSLRALGCRRAQGYRYARPMPASEMALWLRSRDL